MPTDTGSPLYRDVVTDVRRCLSMAEVASITGVSERAVQNWANGSSKPEGTRRTNLLHLWYVLDRLGDVYAPEAIEIWVHSPQRAMSGRQPLDLLREGQFDTVLALVDTLAGGPVSTPL